MNILKNATTLLEIEKMIEEEITSSENNIRIIGDINLSFEEYKYIKLKLKGLGLYRKDVDVWDKYKLCTVVAWVFALRYDEKDYFEQSLMENFGGIQQYIMRYMIDMYNDVFDEFGIEIPGQEINSIESLKEAIALQAGVPDELHDQLYAALEDTINYPEAKVVDKEVLKKMSLKMNSINDNICLEAQNRMLNTYRKVFYDLRVKGLSEKEVLRRNPFISVRSKKQS